jgi:hypothetical protein
LSKQLQHKLLNYNAQPPAQVWDKISIELDNGKEDIFPERMANYELKPPSFIWDKITIALDESETTVLPIRNRFSRPLKYSSAAAGLIAIAVLVSLLINKKSVSEVASTPDIKQNIASPAAPRITEKQLQVSFENPDKDKSERLVHNTNIERPAIKILPLPAYSSYTALKKRAAHVIDHSYPIEEPEYMNRYIIFSEAPGEAFRLSKKLFDLFACSDYNKTCKENIEAVQQKMLDPSIMASADFSSVMDALQIMNNQ